MMFPVAQLMDLVQERSSYRQSVVRQMSESTSREQRILGPLVIIPYSVLEERNNDKGEIVIQKKSYQHFVLPEMLEVKGESDVESRKLGIYQAQIYQGPLKFKVHFDKPNIEGLQRDNITIGQPFLLVSLSDSRGIKFISSVNSEQQQLKFEPGVRAIGFSSQGVHAPLILDSFLKKGLVAEFTLTLTGTNRLALVPIGRSSEFILQSNWAHPNFIGKFLPDERKVTDNGFHARWQSSWFANNINNEFVDNKEEGASNENLHDKLPTFTVSMIKPVDHYLLTERAVKYAVLFLGLTFMAFFLFETLTGLRVHPIQYLLVGTALVLFYLILLAFSEHIGFDYAYLLASLACSGLIASYLEAVMRSKLRGVIFSGGLLLLYGILYLLLQSEDNALVLGAGLLFLILSGIMLLTRKLDWYQLHDSTYLKSTDID